MNYKILLAAPLAAYLAAVSAADRLAFPKDWTVVMLAGAEKRPGGVGYEVGVAPDLLHDGQPVLILRAKGPNSTRELAALHQDALNYQGQRVRLSGWMRAEGVVGWGGLYVATEGRGDGAAARGAEVREGPAFPQVVPTPAQGLQPLAASAGPGDGQWHRFAVVAQVPDDAAVLRIGAVLNGAGTVWVSGLSFDVVGADQPLTTERSQLDAAALQDARQRVPKGATGPGSAPRPPRNLDLSS